MTLDDTAGNGVHKGTVSCRLLCCCFWLTDLGDQPAVTPASPLEPRLPSLKGGIILPTQARVGRTN